MSSGQGTAYVLRDGAGEPAEGWLTPAPVAEVVVDALVAETPLSAAELAPIEEYVDPDALAAVVGDGDRERVTVAVEGHRVRVTADGDVTVDPE